MPSRRASTALTIASVTIAALALGGAFAATANAAPPPGKGKPTPTAEPTSTSDPDDGGSGKGNGKGKNKPTPTPTPTPTDPPDDGFPDVVSAAGDSITLAFGSAGLSSNPAYSWSTGTALSSHLVRLEDASGTDIAAFNHAQVGATSEALGDQVAAAIAADADYLTIEIGANDACASSVAAMTDTAVFSDRVSDALSAYAAQTDGEVFIASIPNLYRMWEVSHAEWQARLVWGLGDICPSMLANPGSTSSSDEQRRRAVQTRVDEYNAAIASLCTATVRCHHDHGAVADYVFTSAHVSTSDYFHPSIEGQRVLAEITWPHTPFAAGG